MLKKLFTHGLAFWFGGCVSLFGIVLNFALASDSSITSNDIFLILVWPYYFWSLL
jgi:hypothetical protein